MSDTVRFKGKLIPTGKTLEEFFKDVELPKYYESLEEYLYDHDEEYQVVNNLVYKVEGSYIDYYSGIFNAGRTDEGGFSIDVLFYNGGIGLTEAVGEALKGLDNE